MEPSPVAANKIAPDRQDGVGWRSGRVEDHYRNMLPLHPDLPPTVFKARHKKTSSFHFIRRVCKDGADVDAWHAGVEVMRRCDHPNIVKLYEAFESEGMLAQAMELCNGTSLSEFSTKERVLVTEQVSTVLALQMFSAVEHLHALRVCHGTLGLDCFLFQERVSCGMPLSDLCLKLVDFGLVVYFGADAAAQWGAKQVPKRGQRDGASACQAPEQARASGTCESCTPHADVWALAVMVFYLLSGMWPELDAEIAEPVLPCRLEVTVAARVFITKALVVDPRRRPSAKDLLGHKWLNAAEGYSGVLLRRPSSADVSMSSRPRRPEELRLDSDVVPTDLDATSSEQKPEVDSGAPDAVVQFLPEDVPKLQEEEEEENEHQDETARVNIMLSPCVSSRSAASSRDRKAADVWIRSEAEITTTGQSAQTIKSRSAMVKKTLTSILSKGSPSGVPKLPRKFTRLNTTASRQKSENGDGDLPEKTTSFFQSTGSLTASGRSAGRLLTRGLSRAAEKTISVAKATVSTAKKSAKRRKKNAKGKASEAAQEEPLDYDVIEADCTGVTFDEVLRESSLYGLADQEGGGKKEKKKVKRLSEASRRSARKVMRTLSNATEIGRQLVDKEIYEKKAVLAPKKKHEGKAKIFSTGLLQNAVSKTASSSAASAHSGKSRPSTDSDMTNVRTFVSTASRARQDRTRST